MNVPTGHVVLAGVSITMKYGTRLLEALNGHRADAKLLGYLAAGLNLLIEAANVGCVHLIARWPTDGFTTLRAFGPCVGYASTNSSRDIVTLLLSNSGQHGDGQVTARCCRVDLLGLADKVDAQAF